MTDEDLKRWRTEVRGRALARFPEREGLHRSGGESIRDIYTHHDLGDPSRIGLPGLFPFTRGTQPTMYRASHWTMRQYAGFGTAAESNARYKYLLSQGTTGLSMAFDLPTQMGYDSDDEMSLGEVGRVGVAVDTLEDMGILLDELPLEKVSSSMTINSTASTLLAMYVAVAKQRGIDPGQLRGTIQNDVLKEYIARGQNREGRLVPEKYARECMRCYEYLLESYPSMTRYQRFEDIPEEKFIPRPPVINAEQTDFWLVEERQVSPVRLPTLSNLDMEVEQ